MKVAIIFQSKSDTEREMKGTANCLRVWNESIQLYVTFSSQVPEKLEEETLEKELEVKVADVIIAGAELAAHLPGLTETHTTKYGTHLLGEAAFNRNGLFMSAI